MDLNIDDELDDILNSAKKLTRKRPRKPSKTSDDDDDDDYGAKSKRKTKGRRRDSNGTSSEDNSDLDSDDSDAESSDEDEDDGYGADLMGDEQDRAMLMAMTEIQREKILSERSEQREVRRARLALKRRAKEVMQREKHEHSQKSSSKKAKQQAKEAERRAAKEARENENKRLTRRSTFSNVDEESSQSTEHIPSSLQLVDFRKAQVSRLNLTDWQWLPNFGDIVRNCYVRILIGESTAKQRVYRVAQISNVTKYHRTYKFEKKPTDRALELKIGSSKRIFQMSFVSNSAIPQIEMDIYLKELQTANIRVPTARSLEPMVEAIEAARKHTVTTEERNYMINEKTKIRNTPRNHVVERAEIERQIYVARQEDQIEEVKRLQDELEELEEFANELIKKQNATLDLTKEINRKHQKKQMEDEISWADYQASKSNNEDMSLNPFARRRYQSSLVRVPSPQTQPQPPPENVAQPPPKSPTKSPLAAVKPVNAYELVDDFDLDATAPAPDLAIPVASAFNTAKAAPLRPVASTGGRSYNLTSYNAKRGIL